MTPPCVFALATLLQQALQPHTFRRVVEALLSITCLQLLIPVCLAPPTLHATVPAVQRHHMVTRLVSKSKEIACFEQMNG